MYFCVKDKYEFQAPPKSFNFYCRAGSLGFQNKGEFHEMWTEQSLIELHYKQCKRK